MLQVGLAELLVIGAIGLLFVVGGAVVVWLVVKSQSPPKP